MSETKKNTSWLFEVFYRSLTLEHFQAGLLGHHLASLIAECSQDELDSIEAELRCLAQAKDWPDIGIAERRFQDIAQFSAATLEKLREQRARSAQGDAIQTPSQGDGEAGASTGPWRRILPRRELRRDAGVCRTILFVCSGNINRSVMAEAFAQRFVECAAIPARIASAGTRDVASRPANLRTRKAMEALGYDVTTHRSKVVKRAWLKEADLVVVMQPEHRQQLASLLADIEEKLVDLWRYAEGQDLLEIEDPQGEDMPAFIACRDTIYRAVQRLLRERLLA